MGLFGEDDPREMPEHFFHGARHVDYDTAVRADISKQNFSVCPRYWYIDATFFCDCCREVFVFAASEQKFWYEELQFWVDSYAKACRDCRADLRGYKRDRDNYGAQIKSALLREASADLKRRAIKLINRIEQFEGHLSGRMEESRSILRRQLGEDS